MLEDTYEQITIDYQMNRDENGEEMILNENIDLTEHYKQQQNEYENNNNDQNVDIIENERQKLEMEIMQREIDERNHLEQIEMEIHRERELILEQIQINRQQQLAQQDNEESGQPSTTRTDYEEKFVQELEFRKQNQEIETEKHVKRVEQIKLEHKKQQEKLQFENKLNEICTRLSILNDSLSILKLEIEDKNEKEEQIDAESKSLSMIDVYSRDLVNITDEIRHLTNQINNKNELQPRQAENYYLGNTLDQVTHTQLDLIRSFIDNLNSQFDSIKSELLKNQIARSQLNECEENLRKLHELAFKYLPKHGDASTNNLEYNFCENVNDLEQRLGSIESIEHSIRANLRQVVDLNQNLNLKKYKNKSSEFDELLHCVEHYSINLRNFINESKEFILKFNDLKSYYESDVKINEILEIKNKEDGIEWMENVIKYSEKIEHEYEKYFSLREKLIRKDSESEEFIILGSNLFEGSKHRIGLVLNEESNSLKAFKDSIREVRYYLDEKCTMLSFIVKEHEKLDLIVFNVNQIQLELEKMEFEYENSVATAADDCSNSADSFKTLIHNLLDLKQKLNFFMQQKNDAFSNRIEHNSTELNSKLELFAKKFKHKSASSMKELVNRTFERLNTLEVRIDKNINHRFL
jgi:hypothetical protein